MKCLRFLGALLVLLSARAVLAEPCKLTIEATDQMRYSMQRMTIPPTCSEVEITLHHSGKLSAKVMGHNWVLARATDMSAIINAGLSAGSQNEYLPRGDERIIAATHVVGGGESSTATFNTSALQDGKCTQVLRASYFSGDGKMMGTIGVANLSTTNEAHHAGKLVGNSDFVDPLTTTTGVTSKLGKGTGIVEAEYKGHYLIMIWAEFTSTNAPANNAQDQQLQQFGADLIAGTANISLSQRMLNGHPATAAAS